MCLSLPVWGVWIETQASSNYAAAEKSLPVWGVWIETEYLYNRVRQIYRHSPYGGCGLKLSAARKLEAERRHSPYGGCGLKQGYKSDR